MPTLTTTTPSTPGGRIRRSVYQVAIGLVLSLPVVLNAYHSSAAKAGKYGGTTAGVIAAVCVLQNVAERNGWLKVKS